MRREETRGKRKKPIGKGERVGKKEAGRQANLVSFSVAIMAFQGFRNNGTLGKPPFPVSSPKHMVLKGPHTLIQRCL